MAVLFLLTVIAAVLATTLTMTAADVLDSSAQSRSVEALLLAESGVERQVGRLASGVPCDALMPEDWVSTQIQLLSAAPDGSLCRVRVSGTSGDAVRTVDAWLGSAGGVIDIGNVVVTSATGNSVNVPVPVAPATDRTPSPFRDEAGSTGHPRPPGA